MVNNMSMMMNEYDAIGINQCLCLPKAELNTKKSTSEFLMFHSIHLKKNNNAFAKTDDVIYECPHRVIVVF